MIKRIFLLILLLLAITGIFTVYKWYKNHELILAQRQNAKAPEITLKFIEGWNNHDIAANLQNDANRTQLPHVVDSSAFLAAEKKFDISTYPILSSRPTNADLEGFLFPDSYRFYLSSVSPASSTPNEISDTIITKMLDTFEAKFTPQMEQEAKARNLSIYQIVTLASIIEKESGRETTTQLQKDKLQQERQTIAGIFYNRLSINMALESDATVDYVTGKNSPQASLEDTKIDNPYNTYRYKGLPPGPICNPSLSSLKAALEPIDSNYMYFLHRQDTGEAVYAKTYDEQLANKQKYLK